MRIRSPLVRLALLGCLGVVAVAPPAVGQALPALTGSVNDFAQVIDPDSRATLDRVIRTLQQGTGDVIVVATIPTFRPAFGDIRDYAVKMFENGGRGIGDKEKDNGLLVLVAVDDRKVWIEVGYGLEGPITDGVSGSVSRNDMVPLFRQGQYGKGLVAGVTRLASRVAEERGVTLSDLPTLAARPARAEPRVTRLGARWILALIVGFVILNMITNAMTPTSVRGRRGRGGWSSGGWSGWGGGGSFGGGSFGGGFGGFGGGGSGGGGGGSSW